MTRRFLLLALALALPLGAARAADHIRVGVVHSLGPAPVFIAAGKGYFAEQGLDAELVFFESAQPVAIAAAAGDIDFGCTGMTAAFLTLTAQGSLKIIGAGTWEHQGFQSIGFLISNQAYDAGVKGFKDFGGHSVGITQRGSPLDHDLGRVLEKYSVPLASIRVLPLQSNQNIASAITGGQADAAVLSGPNIYALINKDNARLLAWSSDELKVSPGNATYTSGKDANERPEAVKHFLAAFRKGAATWDAAFLDAKGSRADQPSAPEIIAIAAKGLGQSEDVIRLGLTYFDPEVRVSARDIQASLDWYYAQGMLKMPMEARNVIVFRYAIEAK